MIQDMTEAILSIAKTLSRVSEASTESIDARGNIIRSAEPVTIEFQGSLQPMRNKDLVHLPVGYEIQGKWKLYVPISEIVLTHEDVILDGAKRMIVTQVEDWTDEGAYIKYILEEVNIGTR
jgi:hypothetical protein